MHINFSNNYFLDVIEEIKRTLFLALWNFQFSVRNKQEYIKEKNAKSACIFRVKPETSLTSLICGRWLQALSPAPWALDHSV